METYNNPYVQYKQTSIETANPIKLLLMLFDGAIKFTNLAIDAVEKKDYEKTNLYVQKTTDIIQELMINLDMNIEVSHKLYILYDYFYRRLIEANAKKDKNILEEVLQFLLDFKEAWTKAAAIVNNRANFSSGVNIEG